MLLNLNPAADFHLDSTFFVVAMAPLWHLKGTENSNTFLNFSLKVINVKLT